ncbi:MAG TPA: 3-dehydroquinate synthase [Bacillales bacterium]|nr:3-dehydroquinate synthase [Bacillales bacterium]
MESLTIEAASKTYPVLIGSGLRHTVDEILADLRKSYSSFLVITDDLVAEHYLDDVLTSLEAETVYPFTVKHGEQAKSFDSYYACQSFALEKGLDRKSAIVALGGGVIGDLAGFVAATFMRGVGFIQLPTTLLAHDSSVGGKTAINHPFGKNLIGSFYQPDAVIFDTDTLKTLPMKELRSGFTEIFKHGLIGDPSLYETLQNRIGSPGELRDFAFDRILKRAIRVKADIVRRDEKEEGVRAHLNLGHTLGHAIEAELGYGKITHGEAVAIGILFAMRVSEAYYDTKLPVRELSAWLENLGYAVRIPADLTPEALLRRMKKDKKAEKSNIRFVLMKEIGKVETDFLDDAFLLEQLTIDRKR